MQAIISLAFFFLVLSQRHDAQMHWEEVFDNLSYESTVKPAPRRDLAIGHDRDRNRVIIFGGRQTNSDQSNGMYSMLILFDDTWEFNLETRIWKQLSYSLDRPSARYGMLYTHSKYGLYISCGRNWIDFYNDLWIYDYSQDIWRKMDQTFISIVPEPRFSPIGGIYPSYEHSSDIKNSLFLGMGRSFWTMYSNMFAYSFSDLRALTGIWEMIYTDINTGPYSFTYPHGRTFASSTMISPDELLIFSGCLSGGFSGGPCPSSDSWIFSYSRNRWDKVDSSCISPRLFSAMTSLVSDGFRQSAVMFSGLEKDKTILKTDYEKEDEVSLYDSFARKWVRKRVQGFYFPEKRNGHAMCTGQYKNKYGAFMFGGYGHESDYNMADLWFLEVNISTVFDNPLVNDFYTNNMRSNVELCSSYFSTIHLHAIVMFIGWGVFINIGTLISTYADSKDERRHRIVSKIYRTLQLIGLLFITAGMFLGFWSTNDIPHLAHLLIGLAAYILALLQPISSYLRRRTKKYDYYVDEQEKSKAEEYKTGLIYTTMKTIHENLSRSAIVLAIINISLGVFYAVFEWYWVLIWFCYLGAFIIIYLLFEANIYFSKLSSDKLSRSVTSKNGQDDEDFDIDGYDLNMSKLGSTQQLTSDTNSHSGRSGSARDAIQMQTIRYSTNNLNTSLRKDKNSKYSPSTPPPPYFINKGGKHQAFSTINLQGNINASQTSGYFQTTSSPLPNRKLPPTSSSLGYSHDIELDEPIATSSNTTPRKSVNENTNYIPRSIQNANQVYSIQTKYSPSSSLRSNNRIETNLITNHSDMGSYQKRMTQMSQQKLNLNNNINNGNTNNNFKINTNQRY